MDILKVKTIGPKLGYGTSDSAGLDLELANDIVIAPGATETINTGISVAIPKGYFGLVVPRSSTGRKNLVLTNTVGIIDADYRGNLMCNIKNIGNTTFIGYRGDKLFQLVILPYATMRPVYVDELETTERGSGGFGSTDK